MVIDHTSCFCLTMLITCNVFLQLHQSIVHVFNRFTCSMRRRCRRRSLSCDTAAAILHNQSARSAADSLRIIDKAFVLTEILIHLIVQITRSITSINESHRCSQTNFLSSESLQNKSRWKQKAQDSSVCASVCQDQGRSLINN